MWGILGFILVISVLVVVHEWGHYAVARACGVRVLAFSIGFGRVLYRRTDRHGTEWRLSALPLGGYVMMLDESTRGKFPKMTEAEYRAQSFEHKSVFRRLAVVAAGPLMNFLLAVVIYSAVAMVGTYEPSTKLASAPSATQAHAVGVERGWKIEAVAGDAVETYNEAALMLMKHIGEAAVPLRFSDETGAVVERNFNLDNLTSEQQAALTQTIGLIPYTGGVVIGRVLPDSPAQAAGIQPADRVISLNGRLVETPSAFASSLSKVTAGQAVLELENLQTKDVRTVRVTPNIETDKEGRQVAKIGVMLGAVPDLVYTRTGFFGGIAAGLKKTWDVTALTGITLFKLVNGDAGTEMISGPIAIGDAAGQSLQFGWLPFVLFLAILSVNLGLINLLPVPVLDGGHILFYCYELVSGRRPSERTIMIGQKIGLGFVLLLMALGITNDITRIFG